MVLGDMGVIATSILTMSNHIGDMEWDWKGHDCYGKFASAICTEIMGL